MPVTFSGAVLSGSSLFSVTEGFSPYSLFASGEQGAWYDPSDYSTMFQDSAGNTRVTTVEQPVGRILDKSGRGNHATQSTSASRPVLSARVNLLLNTATLATQNVTTVAATYTLAFSGAGSITLSGTKTGAYSAGTHSLTGVTAGTLTLTVSGTVTDADLRVSNDGVGLPAYQRVNTSTDYDTVGFPMYLRFDGTDDSLATGSINFTSTDKMTVWAGVRKLSDASDQVIAETYPGSLLPSFSMFNAAIGTKGYTGILVGTGILSEVEAQTFNAPITGVLAQSYDYSGATATDEIKVRVNGALPTQVVINAGPAGAGNFGNYPLNIGSRAGSSLRLNGRLYSLIVRGASSTAGQISDTEGWVNGRTRAY